MISFYDPTRGTNLLIPESTSDQEIVQKSEKVLVQKDWTSWNADHKKDAEKAEKASTSSQHQAAAKYHTEAAKQNHDSSGAGNTNRGVLHDMAANYHREAAVKTGNKMYSNMIARIARSASEKANNA